MQFLKLGLISVIVLFLLVMGMSVLIPSRVRISKAINLKADRTAVMAHIENAAEWKKWYPGLDSATLLFVGGEVKGVILDKSDSLDPAYIIIAKEDSTEVTAHFIGKKMRPIVNVWKVISFPPADSLTLQWYMDFNLRWYPWEKFASLLLEKSYGAKMEQGLGNIKKLVEN